MKLLALGTCALGRALDARGEPLDGAPMPSGRRVRVELAVPLPADRKPVERPFWTGIRTIDALLTLGRGARVGLFGPPGCGKTTLLEQFVCGCRADALVIALCGERGREAAGWIARRDARTTIFCATSDRPAAERVACVHLALAQAGALRERGLHVALIVDSLARFASALREDATGRGEFVGRGGYPPSVFAELARAVECAGVTARGSITAILTVLEDGDERDPVSEAARALLDGHVQLAGRHARAGRFPAIDVCASASRTMHAVTSPKHRADATIVRAAIAALDEAADARAVGLAPVGLAGRAAAAEEDLERFLRQGAMAAEPSESLAMLADLADTLEEPDGYR